MTQRWVLGPPGGPLQIQLCNSESVQTELNVFVPHWLTWLPSGGCSAAQGRQTHFALGAALVQR